MLLVTLCCVSCDGLLSYLSNLLVSSCYKKPGGKSMAPGSYWQSRLMAQKQDHMCTQCMAGMTNPILDSPPPPPPIKRHSSSSSECIPVESSAFCFQLFNVGLKPTPSGKYEVRNCAAGLLWRRGGSVRLSSQPRLFTAETLWRKRQT